MYVEQCTINIYYTCHILYDAYCTIFNIVQCTVLYTIHIDIILYRLELCNIERL